MLISNTTTNDDPENSPPTSPKPCGDDWTGEVFDGLRVHPAASEYPLMEGKEFDEFVESIRNSSVKIPIEIHDGQVIDGRNRLRAAERLRKAGTEIDVPKIDWVPIGDETVEEHIYDVNVLRRHLSDDRRAAWATRRLPKFRAMAEARRAQSLFKPKSTTGNGTLDVISTSPCVTPPEGYEPSVDTCRVTTVGQFCDFANVGETKAKQAIALADAIARGEAPQEEMNAVADGKKPLRNAVPRKARKPSAGSSKPRTPKRDDLDDGDEPEASGVSVRDLWDRIKKKFPVSEHRELRRILGEIISEERRNFDA